MHDGFVRVVRSSYVGRRQVNLPRGMRFFDSTSCFMAGELENPAMHSRCTGPVIDLANIRSLGVCSVEGVSRLYHPQPLWSPRLRP
jgi:hypothetical protein